MRFLSHGSAKTLFKKGFFNIGNSWLAYYRDFKTEKAKTRDNLKKTLKFYNKNDKI